MSVKSAVTDLGATAARWVDLLDPTVGELAAELPSELHDVAAAVVGQKPVHGDEPRPTLRSEGNYVFGLLVVPVYRAGQDRVVYQQVSLVMDEDLVVTVRRSAEDGSVFDATRVHDVCDRAAHPAGGIFHQLVDQVAECYLTLADAMQDEIDELEDGIESWDPERVRSRLSGLRHDLLKIRRILGPTRDALRGVVDDRVEIDGDEELFPRDIEVRVADAYDKLLRATESLDLSRDLLSGVRDYHQAKVANDQNEVMKRLTVIASLLLVPTLIVGVYGQNFDRIPELHWFEGYAFSWGLIIATTLAQLWFFKKKDWL